MSVDQKKCEEEFRKWLDQVEETAATCDQGISQHETHLMESAWDAAWATALELSAVRDLLEALQSAPLTLHTGPMFADGACRCSQCEFVHKANAAIVKATSISN